MSFFLYTLHVLTSIFLILVVLLQQGKGADLSVFGGGSTMTAFGARGAASLLHKLTVIGFVLFIFTTLAIGVLQGHGGGSVMAGVEEESAVEAPAAAEEDAGATAEDAAAGDAAAGDAEGEPAAEEPGGVFTEAEDPSSAAGEEGGEADGDTGGNEAGGSGG